MPSYLSSYEIADYPLYKPHWLIFVSVRANTIPAGELVTSMHAQMEHILYIANLMPTLATKIIGNTN